MALIKPKGRRKSVPEFSDAAEFDALSPEEKQRVWEDCDREIPEAETRPLTPAERARWDQIQTKLQANAPDAVTLRLQKRLVERVDAYGAENGLTRHEVFILALHRLLVDGGGRNFEAR